MHPGELSEGRRGVSEWWRWGDPMVLGTVPAQRCMEPASHSRPLVLGPAERCLQAPSQGLNMLTLTFPLLSSQGVQEGKSNGKVSL